MCVSRIWQIKQQARLFVREVDSWLDLSYCRIAFSLHVNHIPYYVQLVEKPEKTKNAPGNFFWPWGRIWIHTCTVHNLVHP